MWFKAKKGYEKVEVEYDGKYYVFHEDRPTEAPKGIADIHKFLEPSEPIKEDININEVHEDKKKKGGKD